MNRKIQYCLTVSASVLALSAGTMIAQAQVAAPGWNEDMQGGGGADGVWSDTYVLTDTDDTTTPGAADWTGGEHIGNATTNAVSVSVMDEGTGFVSYTGNITASASPTLVNGGDFAVKAVASAAPAAGSATASGDIDNTAILQDYQAAGNLNVVLNNSGSLSVFIDASAASHTIAEANAEVDTGIAQKGVVANTTANSVTKAAYGDASVVLNNNSGAIGVSVSAIASGVTGAEAGAEFNIGILQEALNNGVATVSGTTGAYSPTANATLTNAKGAALNFEATTSATASISGDASAEQEMEGGIVQSARAVDAQVGAGFVSTGTVALTNAGTLNIGVTSSAVAAAGSAYASAEIEGAGIEQSASGKNANVTLTNTSDGVINVTTTITATGKTGAYADTETLFADQSVDATGPGTVVDPTGVANLTFVNAGKINLSNTLTATAGTGSAGADAYVLGVQQDANGKSGTAKFDNTGSFSVASIASANSGATTPASSADAWARGLAVYVDGPAISVANSGTFTVVADAQAQSTVAASAEGMHLYGEAANTVLSVNNTGTIAVTASAIDTNATASVAGVGTAEVTGSHATGAVPNGTITNSGTIITAAVTNYALLTGEDGSDGPTATAILVNELTPFDAMTDQFTIWKNKAGRLTMLWLPNCTNSGPRFPSRGRLPRISRSMMLSNRLKRG